MLREDRYVLETPESIEVEFEPAGLGSRFCAMLIDSLWIALAVVVLITLFELLGPGTLFPDHVRGSNWRGWVAGVVLAVLMIVIFDGYFIFFELLMRGQTPGKRRMKLRVVRDDGTPVGPHEVLIRNLLRIVDFLPAFYALGVVVMFPNPLAKRLGDIAAGTIVVKEGQRDYRSQADKRYAVPAAPIGPVNAELQPEERRVLLGFLRRRAELLPEARRQLAERLATPLREKYGGQAATAEDYSSGWWRGGSTRLHHEL